MREVRRTLSAFLQEKRELFDLALAPHGMAIQKIYPMEVYTGDLDLVPCIMLGNPQLLGKAWIGAPLKLQECWQFPLILRAVIDADEEEDTQPILEDFWHGIECVIEDNNNSRLELLNGKGIIHYFDQVPLSTAEFNFVAGGPEDDTFFLREATAMWTVWVDRPLRTEGDILIQ